MKKLLFIIIFLVLSSLVIGDKPTPQFSSRQNSLDIIFPKTEFFKIGTTPKLHFHVFNSTGNLVLNTDASCIIHVYNFTNNHLVNKNLTRDGNGIDFFWDLNDLPNNQRLEGIYPYIVWCNTTNGRAGFVSNFFEMTLTGFETVNVNAYPAIILAIAFYCLLLGLITFFIRNPKLKQLKAFFFLLTVINTLMLPMMTLYVSSIRIDFFKPIAISYLTVNMLVILYFIYIYALHLIKNVWGNEGESI